MKLPNEAGKELSVRRVEGQAHAVDTMHPKAGSAAASSPR